MKTKKIGLCIILIMVCASCTKVIMTPKNGDQNLTPTSGEEKESWLNFPLDQYSNERGYFAVTYQIKPANNRLYEFGCGSGDFLHADKYRFTATVMAGGDIPWGENKEFPLYVVEKNDFKSCDLTDLNQKRYLVGLVPFGDKFNGSIMIKIRSENYTDVRGAATVASSIIQAAALPAGTGTNVLLQTALKPTMDETADLFSKNFSNWSKLTARNTINIPISGKNLRDGVKGLVIPFYQSSVISQVQPGAQLDEVDPRDHLFDVVFDIEYHRSAWSSASIRYGAIDTKYAPGYSDVLDKELFELKMGKEQGAKDIHAELDSFPSIYAELNGLLKKAPDLTGDFTVCEKLAARISGLPMTIKDKSFLYHSVLSRYLSPYTSRSPEAKEARKAKEARNSFYYKVLVNRPQCVPSDFKPNLMEFTGLDLDHTPTPPSNRNTELPIVSDVDTQTSNTMEDFRSALEVSPAYSELQLKKLLAEDAAQIKLTVATSQAGSKLILMDGVTDGSTGQAYSAQQIRDGIPQKAMAKAIVDLGFESVGCDFSTTGVDVPIDFFALRRGDNTLYKGNASFAAGKLAKLTVFPVPPRIFQSFLTDRMHWFSEESICIKQILPQVDSNGVRKVSIASPATL